MSISRGLRFFAPFRDGVNEKSDEGVIMKQFDNVLIPQAGLKRLYHRGHGEGVKSSGAGCMIQGAQSGSEWNADASTQLSTSDTDDYNSRRFWRAESDAVSAAEPPNII
jgi:hypothetical protein